MSARHRPFIGLHGPNGTLVQFYILDPRPEDIHILTVANSLGNEVRFAGQMGGFWPVASHCVEASYVQNEDGSDPTDEEALERLGHDASEGLGLRDLPAPIKRSEDMRMDVYRASECLVMDAFALKYKMAPRFWEKPHVKYADAMLYRTEVRDFRQPGTWNDPTLIGPTLPHTLQSTTPQDAKIQFLERFIELCVKTGRTEAANEGMLALEQLAPRGNGAIESLVDYAFDKVVAYVSALPQLALPRVSKTDNFGV